jgi:hypothetical protein
MYISLRQKQLGSTVDTGGYFTNQIDFTFPAGTQPFQNTVVLC